MELLEKAQVLAEIWIDYRDDEAFEDFIEYNDIGLSLSYFVTEGLVTQTSNLGDNYIKESFDLFTSLISIEEEELEQLPHINLTIILDYCAYRDRKDTSD